VAHVLNGEPVPTSPEHALSEVERAGTELMGDWIAFWNSEHSIYVNKRHRDVHYRTIAHDLRVYAWDGAAMLDYGCGEALHADIVAAPASTLILCEAAPAVRAKLARRFAGHPKIAVRTPEEIAGLPAESFNVVVLHSVAQYLAPKELDDLLALFRRLLRTDGLLVLGDVIPPGVSAWTDAWALIRFAAREGFLGAALVGLVRTFASDYWWLRSHLGLARYSEAAAIEKLAAAGFSARRTVRNIGHNRARMTFIAWPRGGA
jgi:SAM-dependent methyltransferase